MFRRLFFVDPPLPSLLFSSPLLFFCPFFTCFLPLSMILSPSSLPPYAGYEGAIIPFDQWREKSKQDAANNKNVWIIDLYELKEDESPPCLIEHKYQFCYMLKPGSQNRFVISFPKFSSVGIEGWNKIFALIRQSPWAQDNGNVFF